MHASSLENMQKCYERYVWGKWMNSRGSIRLLDLGGADVNGSYREIFSEAQFEYCVADVAAGPGVDLVLDDPYSLPFEEGSIDLVISGQAFEHVEYFWELFREMSRVVTDDGFLFLIAPSSGPIHRYPVDCYRFYPDSYHALAKYAGIELVECRHDDRGPWNDLVGVFSKTLPSLPVAEEIRHAAVDFQMNAYQRERAPAPLISGPSESAWEAQAGSQDRYEVLRAIHRALEPKSYLEIGIRLGRSLALSECPAIGVDPLPEIRDADFPLAEVYRCTSDYFFEFAADEALARGKPDLALIDGMHLFEFVLRDFINLEQRGHENSILVIDDIFPNHLVQASRTRQSAVWAGEVWKLYHCLLTFRPDLKMFPLDAAPTGLLVVAGLNAGSTVLRNSYNPLVREYRAARLEDFAELILDRRGALHPGDPSLFDALGKARESRRVSAGEG